MVIALLLSICAHAATIKGTVRADDGTPLSDATVQAFDTRLQSRTASTDRAGRYTLTDLASGPWRLRASPHYTDPQVARYQPDVRPFCDSPVYDLATEDVLEDIDFALPTGASLTGALEGPDGAPAPLVTVWAIGIGADTEGLARPALTDADGEFEIKGLDGPVDGPGEWIVFATSASWPDQYLPQSYEIADGDVVGVPAGGLDIGTVALLPGITIAGNITGPDGPVEGGSVHVYAGGQVRTVETDTNGDYVAQGLPPGDILPWADVDGLALTYWPDHDRPVEFFTEEAEGAAVTDLDIAPPEDATFRARLTDAETGDPIGGVQGLLYNDTRTVGWGSLVDDDGLLELDGLHPGRYSLYIWAEKTGHADDWARDAAGDERIFEITEAGVAALVDVSIPRAALVSGVAIDSQGDPVVGAVVIMRNEHGDASAGYTDADGAWSIGGMTEGEWSLETQVDPICPGDPGYVPTYWQDEVYEPFSQTLGLGAGEHTTGVELVLPDDDDHDGMADEWERTWSLDTTGDDSALDADSDGYSNLTEYRLDTNPRGGPPPLHGCSSGCSDSAEDTGGAERRAAIWVMLPLLAVRRRR